jgi:TPR repeat protein
MNKGYVKLAGLLCALAISGTSQADYEAGVTAAQNGDYETALREFREAADAGLDLAQFNLAVMYFTGRGVTQDYAEAFRWTLAAAEQGHLNAQFNLGALYYTGMGTEADFEKAFAWYMRAAESQHAEAQYNLATMYELGEGTEQDLVRAFFWASASAYNEFADAPALQQALADKMSIEELSAARGEFARWRLEQ